MTPAKAPSRSESPSGFSGEVLRARHQEWADSNPARSECLFCNWSHQGTAGECREAALEHRQQEHPEACIRKPRGKGRRITKRKLRSASEEEQIKVDAAEANRVRREREVAEMLEKVERGRARLLAAGLDSDGGHV